jgi:hypothetical protein
LALMGVVAAAPLLLTFLFSTLLQRDAQQRKVLLHERYLDLRARLESGMERRREVELGSRTLQSLPDDERAVLLAAGWFSASDETGWFPPFSAEHVQHLRSQRGLLRQQFMELVSECETEFGCRPEDLLRPPADDGRANPSPR